MNYHSHPHTFVNQVDIKVQNLERSLAFYQNVIGFQLLEQADNKAFLTADGKTPLLIIEQPEYVIPKQPRKTGLYHFALLLPSRPDLASVLNHLIEIGYPLQGASDHLVSEALYLGDPDGNGIEIYADRPSSLWDWNDKEVVMATKALDADGLLAEGKGLQWAGLPAGTLLGHIHLHVSEMENTKEFYTKGLGFQIVSRYGNQVLFLSTGGYHHHIGLNTWNGVGAQKPAENSVGLKSFSLVLPDEETRKKTIEQLTTIGAAVKKENDIVITHDPSGNQIQLIV
ncbi:MULTISPECIES: VOC family protein [Bacillus]|uniref:Glyoxalase n=2 Tax=Bacillus TaxID=1386 RepID=A0A0M4FXF3_9BACI|nr:MULTISPECIES: VOC family protein [Bacillus]ALC83630.1 glyoxalase [Bacillus gobiensis]MBP1082640.1 catechol 2,3-dioxygenase [Bacillus capparidis]MED1097132.1 VOC family protein [Bacillus capparidis]